MSENPVSISNLNDFIFCPVSIYFHNLEADTDDFLYKDSYQLNGSAAHEKSDKNEYTSKKSVLQAIPVFSCEYNISGKIDLFNTETGILTERKKKIKTVYDGYVFQIYAQYFALKEMGYCVKKLCLHSIDDNKTYTVAFPEDDENMFQKFKNTLSAVANFDINSFKQQNESKCMRCIYEPLCSFSCLSEVKSDNDNGN